MKLEQEIIMKEPSTSVRHIKNKWLEQGRQQVMWACCVLLDRVVRFDTS